MHNANLKALFGHGRDHTALMHVVGSHADFTGHFFKNATGGVRWYCFPVASTRALNRHFRRNKIHAKMATTQYVKASS
ncbi:MAG: hypothetical protein ACXWEP_04610 [Halobacteriota archaeon]